MRFTPVAFILFVLFTGLNGSRFRCDYTYLPEAQGYFKLNKIPANWHEARLRCHLEGTILVSPTNEKLRSAMQTLMYRVLGDKTAVFTGIHATFSRGDFRSVEGVPLSKIPQTWAAGEPNNYDDKEQCIAMMPNGQFGDVDCSLTLPYICYYYSTNVVINNCGTVDPEYVLDARTGNCYKFHRVPRTWSRAFMACTAEGGYLAIINSKIESQVILEIFAKHPAASMRGPFWKDVAFIGFHDWDEHGEFLTINGGTLAKAGFDTFSPGEPNNSTTGEYCGAVYRNGLFDDLWCQNSYAFICEKDPKSLICDNE